MKHPLRVPAAISQSHIHLAAGSLPRFTPPDKNRQPEGDKMITSKSDIIPSHAAWTFVSILLGLIAAAVGGALAAPKRGIPA